MKVNDLVDFRSTQCFYFGRSLIPCIGSNFVWGGCTVRFTKAQAAALLAGIYFFLAGSVFSFQGIDFGFGPVIASLINVLLIGTGIALILFALYG